MMKRISISIATVCIFFLCFGVALAADKDKPAIETLSLKEIMKNSKSRLIEGEIVEKEAISVPLPKKKLTEE